MGRWVLDWRGERVELEELPSRALILLHSGCGWHFVLSQDVLSAEGHDRGENGQSACEQSGMMTFVSPNNPLGGCT